MAVQDRLRALARVCQEVGVLQDLEQLLERTLDLVVEHLAVERAIVFLWDPEAEDLRARAARGPGSSDLEEAEEASRSALDRALAGGGPLHLPDIGGDGASGSAFRLGIRGLVSAPIVLGGRPVGVVYADNRSAPLPLSEEDLAFVAAFADQLGVSIENARLHERVLGRAATLERVYGPVVREIRERCDVRNLVGRSAAFREVLDLVDRLRTGRTSVLILGESGTGKELVARAIHYRSDRRSGPFVALNCAALPENLLEAELFGIEDGVATGVRGRTGRFEDATGGTLFLDEIGDMAGPVQAKVLRVLQERTVEKVGGKLPTPVDVRVIAATSRRLEEMVATGEFREDLFYRLAVFPIRIPPLRDRPEDIADLAGHFLESMKVEHGKKTLVLSDAAIDALGRHDWPGNVRELQNVIERSVLLARGPVIGPEAFALGPGTGGGPAGPFGGAWIDEVLGLPFEEARARVVERYERLHVEHALTAAAGNVSQAARAMGLRRQRLHDVLRRLGIDAADFRSTS